MGYAVLLVILILISLFIAGFQWLKNRQEKKEIKVLQEELKKLEGDRE